jgi:hypothetical protein
MIGSRKFLKLKHGDNYEQTGLYLLILVIGEIREGSESKFFPVHLKK